MSTYTPATKADLDVTDVRIAVVAAEWNSHITGALSDGAVATLKERGLKDDQIEVFSVPGTVELTYAASQLIEASRFDAVIIIGCVIKGDTPHFDYVCQSVTQGVTLLNAKGETPVIFGLVTTENQLQAQERAGGRLGNKGTEAAAAAISMALMHRL